MVFFAVCRSQQIAFYGSTPAYRPVLEHHGWGSLQDDLNKLSKQGQWVEMGNLITDEILHTFAAVGTPNEVAEDLHRRYQGAVDRLSFYSTANHAQALQRLRELEAS